MAINKKTIISVFDEKLTLMQWLKTINKALDEAVLTGVEVRQKGNSTFSFVITFEDGTELESNEFVLAQGESINGATIRNGHLYLTLTNGDELDAGNIKPVTSFAINESQHLIVNYGDGTSQDLGAIFSGNVNIDGTLTANIIDGTQLTGNEIVEKMSGYSWVGNAIEGLNFEYSGIVKNGNKLTISLACKLNTPTQLSNITLGHFKVPISVGSKIINSYLGSDAVAYEKYIQAFKGVASTPINLPCRIRNQNNLQLEIILYSASQFELNTDYIFRVEATFLLNDNMAN